MDSDWNSLTMSCWVHGLYCRSSVAITVCVCTREIWWVEIKHKVCFFHSLSNQSKKKIPNIKLYNLQFTHISKCDKIFNRPFESTHSQLKDILPSGRQHLTPGNSCNFICSCAPPSLIFIQNNSSHRFCPTTPKLKYTCQWNLSSLVFTCPPEPEDPSPDSGPLPFRFYVLYGQSGPGRVRFN